MNRLFLAASLLLLSHSLVLGQGVLRTEREACLVLPQELISGPVVTGVLVDPETKWVALSRVHPEASGSVELSISLWNPRTRRTSVAWKQTLEASSPALVSLDGMLGNRVLATIRFESRTTILSISPSGGASRTLAEFSAGTYCSLTLAPDSTKAWLNAISSTQNESFLFDERGKLTAQPALNGAYAVTWSETTGQLLLRKPAAEGTPAWLLFDPKTSEIKSIERPERPIQKLVPEATPELRFVKAAGKLLDERKTEHRLNPLWLEDRSGERVLLSVAPELRPQAMLPAAALYLADGALWAAPIQRVERTAFEIAHREAQRKATLANVRQLESALEQYAMDNKGFPPVGADVLALLCGPDAYIRSDDAFRDSKGASQFNWSWSGETDSAGRPKDGAILGVLKSTYGTVTLRYGKSPAWD